MARLVIHLEPITQFREAAKASEADPVRAAILGEIGGADGIACSLSEGGSFSDRDLRLVKETVKTNFILFVSASDALTTKSMAYSPEQVILMPAHKPGTTSGGGLDALGQASLLEKLVHDFRSQDIHVSLFVEPMIQQVKAAAKLNADGVHLHLGRFASLNKANDKSDFLENLNAVSLAAGKMGLTVSIGSGLNYQNISSILSAATVDEVVSGRAVLTRALWIGLESAVRDMAALVH